MVGGAQLAHALHRTPLGRQRAGQAVIFEIAGAHTPTQQTTHHAQR